MFFKTSQHVAAGIAVDAHIQEIDLLFSAQSPDPGERTFHFKTVGDAVSDAHDPIVFDDLFQILRHLLRINPDLRLRFLRADRSGINIQIK